MAEPTPTPAPTRVAGRYLDRGPLGEGGHADVRRAWDERLDRWVALKILRAGASAEATRRFHAEGALTARLAHPGVVPVHDRGALPDGRPWFAMGVVQGRTLGDLIWERGVSLRRGVRLLAQVAEVVAHAHARGVVHLDLKPDNVMVDDHDNAYVLDWGIAGLRLGEGRANADRPVLGSGRYLAPERRGGAAPAPAADVFALGHILGDLLDAHPQHRDAVDLWALRRDATAVAPDDRRWRAHGLARALFDWLDGVQARARARELLVEAEANTTLREARGIEAARAQAAAADAAEGLSAQSPQGDRAALWALEDAAAAAARAVDEADARVGRALHAALTHAPELDAVHVGLAAWYRRGAEAAAARGDGPGEALARGFVAVHDRAGRHADWLAGFARVAVDSDPPNARVTAYRLVEVAHRRVLGRAEAVGERLAHGPWLLRFEHPERAPVGLPISLERGGALDRIRPGAVAPVPVVLPRARPEGCCYIAGGWARVGGDPRAPDPHPARRVWIDPVFLATHPVTVAEYAAFLEALPTEAAARAHLPRHAEDPRRVPIWLSPDGVRFAEARGRFPITSVCWHDAVAYAAWRATRDGLGWRLPGSLEWEKAARGVDGLAWPWGGRYEPHWARMYPSPPSPPGPVAVDAFEGDVSVYGVRGLVGNVRDWCLDAYTRAAPEEGSVYAVPPASHGSAQRVIRGGCWASLPDLCRPAGRFAAPPGGRFLGTGFRLACDAGGGER